MSENEYLERGLSVDLTSLDGKGIFKCPYCKNKISPDDKTEKKYKIIDTKLKDDELEEVTLGCNKCRSRIRLFGFAISSEE